MGLGSDSVLNTIVHPHLHRSLQRAYPSWVTVEAAEESQGDDFQVEDVWTAVPHLAALRGILAAAKAEEKRKAAMSNITITHILDIQSYHPEITETHRVRVARVKGESGQLFNITGVKHDSQGASSRLELELVSW